MYNQRLQMQGLNLNQYLEFTKKSMEDIEKETEPEAKRNVTYRYMIEEISKLENIEIAEEELNKEIENMAIKYNMTKEELIKAFGGKDMISYDLKMRKTIEEVADYVQNNDKNTIVLSTYAPLISLYLNDLDNGDYDLPLRGNLGSKGEEGLIEQIKELSNTQILLLHETEEEKEIYQFAYDAADYIKQNFTYVGQVNKFDIYETGN